MWIKSYLQTPSKRPTWAYVADILIGSNITKASDNVGSRARINVFLQSWNVNLSGNSKLPDPIRSMLRMANKYNMRLDAIKLSKQAKKSLPIWYHAGGTDNLRTLNNSKCGQCLRDIHKVRTVGDLLKITCREKHANLDPPHIKQNHCTCRYCTSDSVDGCSAPHSCTQCAKKLLQRLHNIWKLGIDPPKDALTLTHRWRQMNAKAFEEELEEGKEIIFDPSVTAQDIYEDDIRVFGKTHDRQLGLAFRVRSGVNVALESVSIYTDGSCNQNGFEEATCGSGLWYGPNNERNQAIRVPEPRQSNQAGEIMAILKAVQSTANFAPLKLISDSKYVIRGLTEYLKRWEDQGWIGVENKEILQPMAVRLRLHSAPTVFRWVKGHLGNPGNEGADQKAKEGAEKPEADVLDTENRCLDCIP
ncbi:ribonuclease H-like protein [Panus rudis PR-1116 ss-1]|nr:ribonuclease H-like protein [Panus rudis PR-1116 ss-1]